MIIIENAKNIDGKITRVTVKSPEEQTIDASGLTLLPGLIDPHVHFRTPGHEYKEDWYHACQASIHGGYTMVFDMPNNAPACVTKQRLQEKKALIDQQLKESGVPLRYELYFGADKNNFDAIYQIKSEVIGIKVFMGSSTGDLMMDDDSSLHAIFALASKHNLIVAVHAEDEEMIQTRKQQYQDDHRYCAHSIIRTPEVAAKAVEKAIFLSKMYNTRLYILHVSCRQELALIAQAKKEGVSVFAETTPHHLFLNDTAYETLHGKAQMNPPLRTEADRLALFDAINAGLIDTIGSDHAPHTLDEKNKTYGQCPSGVPGIETTLPLLLNAYHEKKLSLKHIQSLTHDNVCNIFNVNNDGDYVLVDLNLEKPVDESALKTKCGWSPFAGRQLTGWPVYTVLRGHVFKV